MRVIRDGVSLGSTEDRVEAEDAEQPEEKAIAAWKALRRNRSFEPLLTTYDANGGDSSAPVSSSSSQKRIPSSVTALPAPTDHQCSRATPN